MNVHKLLLGTVLLGCVLVTTAGAKPITMPEEDMALLETHYALRPMVQPGGETPLSRQYLKLLQNYMPYIRQRIQPWPQAEGAHYHKRDGSAEHDVRQNASVANAAGILAVYGDTSMREESLNITRGLLRYLAVTHKANLLPTGDGKPWGDHWQSALWAAIAGQGAWLIWDQLDPVTQLLTGRMLAHEADRFVGRPPDDGYKSDTKAEENAWNSRVIVLAWCMFPNHPHADQWWETANIYMMNSFSTAADHQESTVVEGRPVKDWVQTVTIYPDYTLENHNRVHPDYMSTVSILLRNAQNIREAGLQPPDTCWHHAADVLRVLKLLTAANGSHFYVNGQDWWPHRHDCPLAFGGLASVLMQDRESAYLERAALDVFLKLHSRFPDGAAFHPREYNYPNLEEEMMARYSELYLAHRYFGELQPVTRQQYQQNVSTAREFGPGGFVIHRTPEKFASFAWVNNAMGLVFPQGDTWFTSPDTRSMLGHIRVQGVQDSQPRLLRHKAQVLDGEAGFSFVAAFERAGGAVLQEIAMVSLAEAPVLYVERLTALRDLEMDGWGTGTHVYLNEDAPPVARNYRTITTPGSSFNVTGLSEEPQEVIPLSGPWVSVDGRLGIRRAPQGPMALTANHTYERNRLNQEIAPIVGQAGSYTAGQVISQAAVLYQPGAPADPGPLKLTPLGAPVLLVETDGAAVAVNFGSSAVNVKVSDLDVRLDPHSAHVRQ